MTRLGEQTIKLDNPPTITDVASIVGPKEGQGPLAKYFDQCLEDEFWGEKTWEKAESKIIKETVKAIKRKIKEVVYNVKIRHSKRENGNHGRKNLIKY